MVEITGIPAMRQWRSDRRAAGQRVALVPTMGALHEGHLALVDEARRRADAVVMSIFVNPIQFGPGEDFEGYPRDLDRDRALARSRGVSALFIPSAETMYPAGAEVRVVPGATASRWEGEHRPGHFEGVLTIVAKLLHIVEPDVAIFGQKDIQQATLIRAMVRDLDCGVDLVVAPIVRAPDGMALSSRNAYLSSVQREQALAVNRGLKRADGAWRKGTRDAASLEAVVRGEIAAAQGLTVDYVAIVEPARMQPVVRADVGTIIAVAVRAGKTRLLDNHILGTEFF
jgi:pantoate--beta-alanine ligase